MELEIAACLSILIVLVFLATVDMAFSQLSDLSLRRLSADSDDTGKGTYTNVRLEARPRGVDRDDDHHDDDDHHHPGAHAGPGPGALAGTAPRRAEGRLRRGPPGPSRVTTWGRRAHDVREPPPGGQRRLAAAD